MADDILEIKPSIGPGVRLNVNALLKWLGNRGKTDPAARVGQRFLQLFADHGIMATQIQHFIPQVSLDKITPEALLSTLSNDVLNQAAQLFSVRRAWLDGVDDRVYDGEWCYKSPTRFFDRIREIQHAHTLCPVRALYSSGKLNGGSTRHQPLTLVLVEKISELGENDIFRYLPFCDTWDWGYAPSRVQLKAMARLLMETFSVPLPLYRVKRSVLEEVQNGRCVPRRYLQGSVLTEPSLDDYAFSLDEHAQAKECVELPSVLHYIESFDLKAYASQVNVR